MEVAEKSGEADENKPEQGDEGVDKEDTGQGEDRDNIVFIV